VGLPALGAISYALRALRGSLSLSVPLSPKVARDFRLDIFSAMMFGLFNGSVVSYLFVVGRTIGVSPFGISVLVSMPAVGSILSLPISLALQGTGARRFMIASWAIGRGAMVLPLLFSAPLSYTLVAALFLVSTAVSSPFYAQVMQHVYPREIRGQLMSLVRIGSALVTTLTSLLVAWLLSSTHIGYALIFAFGTAAGVSSLLVFARMTPVRAEPRPRQSVREIFGVLKQNTRFASYQGAVFLMGFGNAMVGTLYPLVVVDRLHGGYGPFGVLTVCNSLGYLVSFFVWGKVVDRRGPLFTMGVIGIAVVFQAIGMLLAPSVWWLVPVMLAAGVTLAGFELGVYGGVIHYAPPREVSQYMALHSYFAGIRGLIAPFLATGLLGTSRFPLALAASLLFSATGTALIWRRSRLEPYGSSHAIPMVEAKPVH